MTRFLRPDTDSPLLRQTIARGFDLSIAALVETARIFILVSPILLSIAQIARAESIDLNGAADRRVQAPFLQSYGPFRLVSDDTAELHDATDEATPAAFAQMLRDHPGLRRIVMVECPGTENDEANLQVARMIRAARLATHVPAGGSVRSGGVELFLAGLHRTADEGAEFAVHSWIDADGREARHVPAQDPAHRSYLRFYEEVGLSADNARAFYALTNSAPFDHALYLSASDLRRYAIIN